MYLLVSKCSVNKSCTDWVNSWKGWTVVLIFLLSRSGIRGGSKVFVFTWSVSLGFKDMHSTVDMPGIKNVMKLQLLLWWFSKCIHIDLCHFENTRLLAPLVPYSSLFHSAGTHTSPFNIDGEQYKPMILHTTATTIVILRILLQPKLVNLGTNEISKLG